MPTPSQVSSLSRSSSSTPANAHAPDHPLALLVLQLLPGRLPGLTQKELMRRVQFNLPHWPDLGMAEVRPPVLSAVLASLERERQITSAGEGRERCYWRLLRLPAPLSPNQTVSAPEGDGCTCACPERETRR